MPCTNRCYKRQEKDKLFNDLHQVLDEIPTEELYLLLGYFNARVGSRSETDVKWELGTE